MSNLLIYLAHPNPESLNADTANGMAEALRGRGHAVTVRDLYRLDFDPRLSLTDFQLLGAGDLAPAVREEQQHIAAADGILFVYPVWWWGYPAMLKGLIDRVFTKGFAWDYGEAGVVGKLTGKRMFIAATHGGPRELYEQMGVDPEALHDPLRIGTLGFCGAAEVEVMASFGVPMYASNEVVDHPRRATEAAVAFFAR